MMKDELSRLGSIHLGEVPTYMYNVHLFGRPPTLRVGALFYGRPRLFNPRLKFIARLWRPAGVGNAPYRDKSNVLSGRARSR